MTGRLRVVSNGFANGIVNSVMSTRCGTGALAHLTRRCRVPLTRAITVNSKTGSLPVVGTTKLKVTCRTGPGIGRGTRIAVHRTSLVKMFYVLSNDLGRGWLLTHRPTNNATLAECAITGTPGHTFIYGRYKTSCPH